MTNLQKILEEGITCPCGGTVDIRDWTIANGIDHQIHCPSCQSSIYGPTALEALTRYYVLTGGPVPGMIKPPNNWERDIIFGTDLFPCLTLWRGQDVHIMTEWFFRAGERVPYVIKTWLEKEYTP